jgi:hypothetical protein
MVAKPKKRRNKVNTVSKPYVSAYRRRKALRDNARKHNKLAMCAEHLCLVYYEGKECPVCEIMRENGFFERAGSLHFPVS